MIGFFVNTLILRADLSGDPSFIELLARIRHTAMGAYEHQDLPFEKLVEELNPPRDAGQTPLFQVMFALQNVPPAARTLSGVAVSPLEISKTTTKFDLFWALSEEGDALTVRAEYSTDLFDAGTIERMLRHFETLLGSVVANPEQHISQIALLGEAEKHRLLVQWNDTERDFPRDTCVHRLFEQQVERSPDAIALVFQDRQLSYHELNQRANQLARYLQTLGVGPETPVAICAERSLEMIVAMLAVLKAGGAYLPLDPAYPEERRAFMLADARVSLCLTQRALIEREAKNKNSDGTASAVDPRMQIVYLDEDSKLLREQSEANLESRATAANLAYVMYTSGSTGEPKGVEIPHRAIARLLFGVDYAEFDAQQTFLHLAPSSFDASTFEVWGALLHGAKCVLYPGTVPAAQTLGALLRKHKVSILWLTASLFEVVIDEAPEALAGVRQLLIGGEPLSVPHVRRALSLLPQTKIVNGYGPTESTTFSCCYKVPHGLDGVRSISIGRPIANTEVYILDRHLNPAPIGMPGEIYIGGEGLARGYRHRPELTAEKFIAHPFRHDPAARLYKTGDRARYLPDGNIDFLSRIDDQVKIRGYRIEPGEIESVLIGQRGIREVVVVAKRGVRGDRRLVAYIVPTRDGAPAAAELRNLASRKLPQFMVPSEFIFLDSLPLTPNGKTDRILLAAPDESIAATRGEWTAVKTPTEDLLALIWQNVLGIEQVGTQDNFFDLGGHSLLALKLFLEIDEHLGVDLPLHELFEAPTLGAFAARLEAYQEWRLTKQQKMTGFSYLVELQSGQDPTPVFCFSYMGGFDGELLRFVRLARLVGREYSFYGLRARGTDGVAKPHGSVETMVSDYIAEMQALQSHGPYYLIGECYSGRVAYEAAQQLRARGEQVELLALLDYAAPRQSLAQSMRHSLFQRREVRRLSRYWRRSLARLKELRGLTDNTRELYCSDPADEGPVDQSTPSRDTDSRWLRMSSCGGDIGQQKSSHLMEARSIYKFRVGRYRPRSYDGRVTFLLNEAWYDRDLARTVSASAARHVEIHRIAGDHNSYIDKSMDSIAEILKSCLKKQRAASGYNPVHSHIRQKETRS